MNARAATVHVPSEFMTTTFTTPGVPLGVVACIVPGFTTRTSDAGSPAKKTCAPGRRFAPVIVTRVPPSTEPADSPTETFTGGTSVITTAPLKTEAASPRLTATFFGPSGVVDNTNKSIDALVNAVDETLPPNVGGPRTRSVLEVVNETPSAMSSPPRRSVAWLNSGNREAKPGRVRFKPVELRGNTWMSAADADPATTSTVCASVKVPTFPK